MISRILFITFFFLPLVILYSQEQINKEEEISISGFYDSAHHWYDIKEEKIIHPLPGKPKYKRSEFRKIADNILLFQKSNGGWTKNYDMMAILTDDQKDSIRLSSNEENTTIDNGATYSQIEYLAKVFTKTKEEKFMIGCIKGINFLLEAQYQNGGWAQYYPDTSGYRKYITFNDGAMIGVMKLLKSIVDNEEHFDFLGKAMREKVEASFNRGLECILNCQIKIGEKKYVWCQQHDNINLLPQSARTFEPAAICNQESAEIVLFLMSIKNPSKNIKLAIKDAVDWFEESKIYGIRIKVVDAPLEDFQYHTTTKDVLIEQDKNAAPIWTRFNDLKTLTPIFCRREGKIVYSLEEVERERRTGYAWYTYGPQIVLDLYYKSLLK